MFPRNDSFLNLQLAVNMIVLKHFLAVKIADRIQQLSRERCPVCGGNYVLDNFHECIMTPLKDRIRFWLHKVKAEALDKFDNLINLYQEAAWAESEVMRQYGVDFIVSLQPKDLQDRRYINEDTVELYPFNMSWLTATYIEPTATACPQPEKTQPAKTKSKPKKPTKRKSELDEMEEQLLVKFSKTE